MSKWAPSPYHSHRVQLLGAAVIGGLAAVTTIYSIQAIRRNAAVEDVKASISSLTDKQNSQRVRTAKSTMVISDSADEILSSSTTSVVLFPTRLQIGKRNAARL